MGSKTETRARRASRPKGTPQSRAPVSVKSDDRARSSFHRVLPMPSFTMSINDLVAFATGVRFAVEAIEMIEVDDKLASRIGVASGDNWFSVRGFRHTEGSEPPVCWTEVYINRDFFANDSEMSPVLTASQGSPNLGPAA
jgi:hypothetical protein